MKFLVIGYGSIGRRHLNNLRSLGETDILVYRTGLSTLPQEELEGLRIEMDFENALRWKPNAAIIANPTALHLEYATRAAQAGCHILMEKPVSNSLEGISELEKALDDSGKQLLMGFQFRFHPGLKQVAHLLHEGAAGRPISFHCKWGEYLPGWHPWEDYRKSYSARGDLGGGVVFTLCHPLDYFQGFFGRAASLCAKTGKISELEISVEDFADIQIEYMDGVMGSIHLDYYRRPGVHRLEIICSDGVIQWDNLDGGARLIHSRDSIEKAFPLPDGFERNTLFLDEMRHFLEVAGGATKPACTLDDGIQALQLALAVHRSSREERRLAHHEIYDRSR